jgi:hypothetical protein
MIGHDRVGDKSALTAEKSGGSNCVIEPGDKAVGVTMVIVVTIPGYPS